MGDMNKGASPSGSFLTLFQEIYGRLPEQQRKQFWLLSSCLLVVSVVEMVSVGVIAFFATGVSLPQEILQSKYIVGAKQILGMEFLSTVQGFIVSMGLLVVFMVGLKNTLQSLVLYLSARFGAQVEAFFGEMLFNGFIEMPYEWHLSRNSADIILAVNWRSFIGQVFIRNCFAIMSDITLVFFLVLTLFFFQPLISILLLIIAGGAAFFIYIKLVH